MENKQWWKSSTIILVLCLCTTVFAAWDKTKPSSSTSLRDSNPEILANWVALEAAIGQDHEFSTGGTNSGEHTQIKFNAPISTPTYAANKSWIYPKDVDPGGGAVVELHWLDESNNELQITSEGGLFSSTTLTVTGESTFNNHINLGAGDDLLLSTTSDITISGNTFTVAGATGNTVIAGTLDVTGNIDPTTYETTNGGFLDENDMASDADDKVASQQSIKAYANAGTLNPGLAKGWVTFDGTDADPDSTKVGHNVTSIVDNGTGDYTVTWDTNFSSGNYAIVAFASVQSGVGVVAAMGVRSAGTVKVLTKKNNDNAAVDCDRVCVVAFGTQ